MEKRINKHVFTWVGAFLFGEIGVDRFMRGQIGIGILKLILCGLCVTVASLVAVFTLGIGTFLIPVFMAPIYIWWFIDWIIALTKLGQYKSDFVFIGGGWAAADGTVRETEQVRMPPPDIPVFPPLSVKAVVAVGIGAALMFVLMRFVTVPTGVPNVNVNLGIAVLGLFAAVFGPVAGFLIGFIGHTLVDLTWGWGVWWTWVVCSALFGFSVGLFRKLYPIEEGYFGLRQIVGFNIVQALTNIVVWIGIAPTLDVLINQRPANLVYTQGVTVAAINIASVLVLGTLLSVGYAKTRTRAGSLKAE